MNDVLYFKYRHYVRRLLDDFKKESKRGGWTDPWKSTEIHSKRQTSTINVVETQGFISRGMKRTLPAIGRKMYREKIWQKFRKDVLNVD